MPDRHLPRKFPLRQLLHAHNMKTRLVLCCFAFSWLLLVAKLTLAPTLAWWAVTAPFWVPLAAFAAGLFAACLVLSGMFLFQKD